MMLVSLTFAVMNHDKPKVLVAPLDWGLGHATRCIPVIRELIKQNCEVLICASGRGKIILNREFPQLMSSEIPGISIRYPAKGSMAISMLKQIPGILKAIRTEHKILDKLIDEHAITHVISDNRYGLFSSKVKTAFITHQVKIKSSQNLEFMQPVLNRINKTFISRFNELWIPDEPPPGNLSGSLSDKKGISIPVAYCGILSRFSEKQTAAFKTYDFIALLSGPEPQRTLLEKKISSYFGTSGKKCLVIQGLPGEKPKKINSKIPFMASVSDDELTNLLHPETVLFCRPGYSTVMDLASLGHHKIVFVPTPGQTEQEYLAEWLFRTYGLRYINQHEDFPTDFNSFSGALPQVNKNGKLKNLICKFIQSN